MYRYKCSCPDDRDHRFWQPTSHPITLDPEPFWRQKLDDLYEKLSYKQSINLNREQKNAAKRRNYEAALTQLVSVKMIRCACRDLFQVSLIVLAEFAANC